MPQAGKLTSEQKESIRRLYGAGRSRGQRPAPGEASMRRLAEMYGVSVGAVQYVIRKGRE